ncbi:hypothetical protein E1176_03125 [Fulvivirga sp. RKSG066]|uniref:hypothetical protein n=1 Tax=Fulvivirga aurantia TaxID=2529383 RepID=UPI0012BC3FE6|nr:hypothetical protein [Fulvivirga aurantia]MTI20005.1 hypothetical protein [Fulvivirga aurantia]
MAKRKNPLKDLDDFLKQEATSFVKPDATEKPAESITSERTPLTADEIIEAIGQLASKDQETYRKELFLIIKTSLERLDHSSADDKMLINTLLYLQDKNNWKENIKTYWSEHS